MPKFTQYFWTLAEQSPSLIAMLACLVFALTRWKRYPKVALMVALGLGLMILHVIVFLFVYDLVPPIFLKGAATQSFEQNERIRRVLYAVLGLIYNGSLAIGYGLLVAGIFAQRARPEPNSLSGQNS